MDEAVGLVERNGGLDLPHRDADPVMRLLAHYFEPADLMFQAVRKFDKIAASQRGISPAKVAERRTCVMYWLSGLFVTLESIRNLPLADELRTRSLDIPKLAESADSILADSKKHFDALRLLKNGTFHCQKPPLRMHNFLKVMNASHGRQKFIAELIGF